MSGCDIVSPFVSFVLNYGRSNGKTLTIIAMYDIISIK